MLPQKWDFFIGKGSIIFLIFLLRFLVFLSDKPPIVIAAALYILVLAAATESNSLPNSRVIIIMNNVTLLKKSAWVALACLGLSTSAGAVVFQAENYNAFYDTTPGNTGGAYRGDAVDIEATSDTGGGYNVGWIAQGEWLAYNNLTIPTSGNYTVRMRVASASGATASVDLNGGAIQLGSFAIPATGGWQNWTTVSRTVNLNAGTYSLGVFAQTANWNFNWIEVVAEGTNNPNLPTAYSGYTGVYSGYTLKLDERFNSLNTAIWAKGDGAVGGESICRFQPQGVQIVNGNLELVVRNEYVPGSYSYDHKSEKGPYNYSCGELRTVPSKRIKYGRIEARIKAPARSVATGYISSLFTYKHEGSPREWEEIDVELEGGRPDKFQANLIYGVNVVDWNGTRQWGAWEHKIDIAPADQWRVYAIDWTPTGIKWFVDGVLVKTLNQDWIDCNPSCVPPQVSYTPIPNDLTELMMNFWIPNDGIQDAFGGNKYGNVYPMVTQYDWVRIYQLNSHPLTNW
ncbi:putative beta-glucanase/Beta-glucan synthetase [Cellvibrio sp. BR]|nr:putative beta-glucanase/Beta-glucan synthetase [Cellvibrio sp. BR]